MSVHKQVPVGDHPCLSEHKALKQTSVTVVIHSPDSVMCGLTGAEVDLMAFWLVC